MILKQTDVISAPNKRVSMSEGKRKTSVKRQKRDRDDRPSSMHRKKSHSSLKFQVNTLTSGPELKNIDSSNTVVTGALGVFNSPLVSGAACLLNGTAQGSTENNRIGRKTQMKSLLFNWEYTPNAPATTADVFRIFIVYDKQPNGAFPLHTDILQNTLITTGTQLSNADRFITLWNKWYTQNTVNQVSSGSIYIKMGLETVLSGAAGAIANFNTGSIYVMIANTSNAVGTLTFFSRIRFIDF